MERGSARRSSFEGRRGGHCQSDEHWNCFKGNVRETSERWVQCIMGFYELKDTSRTELNS